MRNKLSVIILSVISFLCTCEIFGNNLPTIELLGKTYYCYEVDKDDSLYGISKKFGWERSIILEINPSCTSGLKKGMKIYYPVDTDSVHAEKNNNSNEVQILVEPIHHKIKRGETVYSIANQYGVTIDDIYRANPEARHGIKAGETLVIEQSEMSVESVSEIDNEIIYYTVKKGDTLYSVARKYATTVESLLELNKGISEHNFKSGSIIRIKANSNSDNIKTESIEEKQFDGFEIYKIQKGDTWKSVASAHNVSVDELKEINSDVKKFKEGKKIFVPVVNNVIVERQYVDEDPREKTKSGREELYELVHGVAADTKDKSVDIGLIVEYDKTKERCLEFIRGFLSALDELKGSDCKINFKVYDVVDNQYDVLLNDSSLSGNDILVCISDVVSPNVAEFGNKHNIEIVNVFDLQNNIYLENPYFFQVMPPTQLFNDIVVNYIYDKMKRRKYIFINDEDETADAVSNTLKLRLDNDNSEYIELSEIEQLDTFVFDKEEAYLILPMASKLQSVKEILSKISEIKTANPDIELSVIGRPRWITYMDDLQKQFLFVDTYIPSRFFFHKDSPTGSDFVNKFESDFTASPSNSLPNYAVMGYDIAMFFIESCIENSGDFNLCMADYDALQTDFKFRRISNWSGFVNNSAYFVRLNNKTIRKINL